MKNRIFAHLVLSLLFVACSSSPDKPDVPLWIHGPARAVDNGYIVYVAKADARTSDRAQFKAEGLALEDLANECSLIPKGARIEDRYVDNVDKNNVNAYVKIGLEFQVCETAKKTVQPEEIKNLASLPFSEQLRKYQELTETGEMPSGSDLVEVTPPEQYASAPVHGPGYDDNIHFFVTRQYVAYQKQIVIFAPPTAYAPGSSENQKFVTAVSPSVQEIHTTEQANPALLNHPTTWSTLTGRPQVSRPQSLASAKRHQIAKPMRVIPNPSHGYHSEGVSKPHQGGGHGKKRKRRREEQEN